MNNNNLIGARTDLIFEKKKVKKLPQKEIEVTELEIKNNFYHMISFSTIEKEQAIKECLQQEIRFFLRKINLPSKCHFFIVGLGNENHTADSVGPKTLKHLIVNSHLESLLPLTTNKLSALEPGVLGETGIETNRIIESVVEEIKPDIVILIDSYVVENIEYLNKTIQITNEGITPGSGLKGLNMKISEDTLGIPVLVIGIPTAIEVTFNKERTLPYILSSKDIDSYVLKMAKIIGEALNEALLNYNLE